MIAPRRKIEFFRFDELVERTVSRTGDVNDNEDRIREKTMTVAAATQRWRRRPATEQRHGDETGAGSVAIGRDYNACCKRASSSTLRVLQSIAIGPGERHLGSMLTHLVVEQIVHSGDDQAVHHQGDCEGCEFRQYVVIHKVSWNGFSIRSLGNRADEPKSVHRRRREFAAHCPRDWRALARRGEHAVAILGRTHIGTGVLRRFRRDPRFGVGARRVTEPMAKLS
jgi:hypothetical protein